ncbi:MAG: 2-hydroxyacid dehydrogenase [Betaproteobacteria bacterium]|nr:MAG: 2-hydroxyacid dehydrogenase [Betaproteobacteria bacterium]
MKPEIVAIAPLPDFFAKPLNENFIVHDLSGATDRRALIDKIAPTTRAMVAFGGSQISPEQLQNFPHLEIVSVFGVGYDGIPLAACEARNIKVTNTPDVLNDEVADTAVALTLMTCRQLVASHKYVEAGEWLKGQYPLTNSLWGKTVGIIGLGRIGKEIATRLQAMKMNVSYFGRNPQAVAHRYYASLVDMARDVDVLIAITPGGAGTKHLVNAAVLEALGPTGFFINVARGSVVDEAALIHAIENNLIAGAGLDVFDVEPKVPAALMNRANVVLTPHVASATTETRVAMGNLVIENLVRHFAGKSVKTLVPEMVGKVAP